MRRLPPQKSVAKSPSVIKEPKERFSATAKDYHRHRPSYPRAMVEWTLKTASVTKRSIVADVGCGTGISTRLFASRGLKVVGIDPNKTMLAYARREGRARYRLGDAAATGLADHSVDLVTVAQAFHWFNIPAALSEFRRILKPAGWCAAFWNVRSNRTAFMKGYERLLQKHSVEYRELGSWPDTVARIKACGVSFSWRQARFPNIQRLDRAGFLGRVYSSSYIAHGLEKPAEFREALLELFQRHQSRGRVDFLYKCDAVAWMMRG